MLPPTIKAVSVAIRMELGVDLRMESPRPRSKNFFARNSRVLVHVVKKIVGSTSVKVPAEMFLGPPCRHDAVLASFFYFKIGTDGESYCSVPDQGPNLVSRSFGGTELKGLAFRKCSTKFERKLLFFHQALRIAGTEQNSTGLD